MPPLVTIDLETTGLEPQKDAIIEKAAVRFSGARVEAEWSTLINPGRPIPPLITQLTGITNDMVRTAPPLKAVIQDLEAFVGTSTVVGHNVRFDLGFLQKQGILGLAEAIDTYELAAVLMPTASRYNLGSLGQILGILIPNSHRALDDARLTHAVYFKLYEQAVQMPIELLAEIVRDSETLDWDAGWFFGKSCGPAPTTDRREAGLPARLWALFASTEASGSAAVPPEKILRWMSTKRSLLSTADRLPATSTATNSAPNRLKCCAPSPAPFPMGIT